MRFFNLDLHISVIQDVKYILNHLFGPTIEITNMSISGHNWVFGAPTPHVEIINQATWRSINPELITMFQECYDDLLRSYDGFIVTHTPVFALLYEKYNKPILLVNSCRYEQPYCWTANISAWEDLSAALARMYARGQLIAVSNNRADRDYLRAGAGINSIHIPSLCLYTNAIYEPRYHSWICYGDRSFFPPSQLLIAKPSAGYSWADLYSYTGIVHIPYEMSTMSLFEQYSAGVPLYLPSKQFYKDCILRGQMPFGSIYAVVGPAQLRQQLTDLDFWLDRADFYDNDNFRFVYFYDSAADLIAKLERFTLSPSERAARAAWLTARRTAVYTAWHDLFASNTELYRRLCGLP